MKKHQLLLLAITSIFIVIFVSGVIQSPGYMDSAYYYGGGIRLFEGKGFSELIIWNFLDDPAGLPHPSHGYWMPMVSILSAFSMIILGQTSFMAGRIPFILLYVFLPVFVYYFAYQLTKNNNQAFLAGFFTIFSGFYIPFLTITETFGLYMLFGSLLLIVLGNYKKLVTDGNLQHWKISLLSFLLGLLTGLMHLTRADGFIWLIVSGIMLIWINWFCPQKRSRRYFFYDLLTVSFGYILVIGLWFVRNYLVFHTALAPGGARALWFTSYNDMFLYPGSEITFDRWWESGLNQIIYDRLWAIGQNLQNAIVVQGMIFLTPLVVLGIWHFRHDIKVIAGVLGWFLTLLVMSIIFPYSGARGGFFHSGSAIQPLFWILSSVGLSRFIHWGEMKRNWNAKQANRVFSIGVILLSIITSGLVFQKRVLKKDGETNIWQKSYNNYLNIEEFIRKENYEGDGVIMVTDPPGYFSMNRRPSIVIPYGDEQVLLDVASLYDAEFLVLDERHIMELDRLYKNPNHLDSLKYLATIDGEKIFQFEK